MVLSNSNHNMKLLIGNDDNVIINIVIYITDLTLLVILFIIYKSCC